MRVSSLAQVGLIVAAAVMASACQSEGESSRQALSGAGCSGSGDTLCIGVNYVSYVGSDGQPIVSQDIAVANIATTNKIFAQCGIAFQVENYQAVDASKYGLSTNNVPMSELNAIRDTFNDGQTFLVAQTGYWGTTKNAWTMMPGGGTYGAIFESTVAANGNIVAHELGHYLNLDHINDSSGVMNAVIYPSSTVLSDNECSVAREAAVQFWGKMLR